jgi:hypothetical protein
MASVVTLWDIVRTKLGMASLEQAWHGLVGAFYFSARLASSLGGSHACGAEYRQFRADASKRLLMSAMAHQRKGLEEFRPDGDDMRSSIGGDGQPRSNLGRRASAQARDKPLVGRISASLSLASSRRSSRAATTDTPRAAKSSAKHLSNLSEQITLPAAPSRRPWWRRSTSPSG